MRLEWRRSINALQGPTAGIMATTKLEAESSRLATAVKTLLPLIAGFFV
jgi:hypothetical protein